MLKKLHKAPKVAKCHSFSLLWETGRESISSSRSCYRSKWKQTQRSSHTRSTYYNQPPPECCTVGQSENNFRSCGHTYWTPLQANAHKWKESRRPSSTVMTVLAEMGAGFAKLWLVIISCLHSKSLLVKPGRKDGKISLSSSKITCLVQTQWGVESMERES